MKQEDFERLKAKLGDEFEIIQDALVSIDGTIAFVRKKDIWDGVEFGKHYLTEKIVNFASNPELMMIKDYFLNYIARDIYTPSTEQAYIEQLKKEAFERFGEIKVGDRFDRTGIKELWGVGEIEFHYHFVGFHYDKDSDRLYFNNLCIYESGKWATRVKEMVKVEWDSTSCDTIKFNYTDVPHLNLVKLGPKMAEELKKYLNGEID